MPYSSGRSQFGELERAVLEVLWALPEDQSASVRQVHTALSESRDVAYTTVMTVLDRMFGKELVLRESKGRAYLYRASATREGLTAELMEAALHNISAEDRAGALVAFVGEASEEDREALRAALAELE